MSEFSGGEFVSIHLGANQPGVATVLLHREPTNALTRQAYRELAAAAREVSERADVAAVILFGGHEVFSTGDDLRELLTLDSGEADAADAARRATIDAVAAIPKPTVAAMTGYALGAGLSLALAADWRVCGDNAKLGATEILSGLVPGGGGCERLAQAVGRPRAKEMAFSGRFVGAEEATSIGLIDELVAPDDVYDLSVQWASRFTDAPAAVLADIKALMNASSGVH